MGERDYIRAADGAWERQQELAARSSFAWGNRCAGFKLDTLLKLADVKGTDRKTSLLHFVMLQLMKENEGVKSLYKQLSQSRAAANLQVVVASYYCVVAGVYRFEGVCFTVLCCVISLAACSLWGELWMWH